MLNAPDSAMQFPCVRQCCLDDDEICLGCLRSLQEIVGWNEADVSERAEILARAQQRREARADRCRGKAGSSAAHS